MHKGIPIAIVTGATRGIGKAIVKKLSQQGVSCLGIGSSMESISGITTNDHLHFTEPNQIHRSMAIDLTNWPQWTRRQQQKDNKLMFKGYQYQDPATSSSSSDADATIRTEICKSLFDSQWSSSNPQHRYYVNLLVNCAGITQDSVSIRTSTEMILKILNVNFASCVTLSNLTLKKMIKWQNMIKREQLTPPKDVPSPCIINISSILGQGDITLPGTSIYSASKAALIQYTKTLAQETETWGIRTQSMTPGLIPNTDMIQDLDQVTRNQLTKLMGLNVTSSEVVANDIWDRYIRRDN
ncbi:3-oxoacyl-[acyl-carrier-protein] reductase (NADPH) NDAI_0C00710 [Naumovozyma dairenensis CBS 421]|uniref:3-oxoacyl-[acyl-carrier-protein] reductase n=1 Tax=Naumovozyma dairenensis (strain ATCC 10597 / BCRC 20456 / CBS 421 / NBRC 0211 / NRRL Y-12639) TaxID=1071378 RepID=G0W7H1_NAUDC|nr:hypothetical protein NDAI_0C00710 [Naumovozyma dairenensis CBS 421]CCD23732.1 hypothetical protein NDAI_0C00710 [Naumovozyma dairenensis CBS 421]